MANPYEGEANTDPFRERVSAQPPTVAAAHSSPMSGQSVPSYGNADERSAAPVKPSFEEAGGQPRPDSVPAPTPESPSSPKPTSKFWTVEFYQQFFNVNTRQVLIRMSNTLVPLNPPDFLLGRNWHYNDRLEGSPTTAEAQQEDLMVDGITLSRSPDLYGPFWICTTLWMVLGIVSNIMGRIAATKADKASEWQYDFSVASVACIVMYLYCFVFGAIVWGIMAWKHLPATFVDTVCLYGYSMFIFILIALLCMVPITALQWVFCIVGGLWSTAYLLINFWHMWKASLEPKWFIGIVALVSLCHFGLTLSFKFYFFHY